MGVSTSSSLSPSATSAPAARSLRWRVVDIVVASVIGVAAGLIFLLWNIAYRGPSALLEPLLPGLQGLLDGPWLFAGVLGALIIRKPGAAVYTEVVAAAVSALTLIGNTWGAFLTLEAGVVQGIGAELVFLLFFYRRWSLPVAILAGVGAALAGGVNNLLLWYAGADIQFVVVYLISTSISGAVIAGGLSWLLARGLAKTGALDRFASGREARARI
jgi:energy-coupling factor transport system substrate-specific component